MSPPKRKPAPRGERPQPDMSERVDWALVRVDDRWEKERRKMEIREAVRRAYGLVCKR